MIDAIVRRMREAREGSDVSREEMAFRLRVDFSTIGRWERGGGKDGPPLWAVIGYATVTGKPASWIVEGEIDAAAAAANALLRSMFDKIDAVTRDYEKVRADYERLIEETA